MLRILTPLRMTPYKTRGHYNPHPKQCTIVREIPIFLNCLITPPQKKKVISWHPKKTGRSENKTESVQQKNPTWWFQPIWKILVKMGSFPQVRVQIKHIWNHHLEFLPLGVAHISHAKDHSTPSWRVRRIGDRRRQAWVCKFLWEKNTYHGNPTWNLSFRGYDPYI